MGPCVAVFVIEWQILGERTTDVLNFCNKKSLKMHLRGPDRSVQMEALEFWVYETAFQQC